MRDKSTAAEASFVTVFPADAFLDLAKAGHLGRDIPLAGEHRPTAWDLLARGQFQLWWRSA
jgi:hypothetical protein